MHWKNRIIVIIACCILVFIVYAIFTGGLAISDRHDFGGQTSIPLVNGRHVTVWLAPRTTKWSIPFILHRYETSGPYGLRLGIYDYSKSYVAIEITEIVVQYADGEVVRTTDKWSRKFQPSTEYHVVSGKSIGTELMEMYDTIDALVIRHTDVTITIKGHLLNLDGHKVEFSASESFKAVKRFRISTFWKVMANV